jgi:hypothetical protein
MSNRRVLPLVNNNYVYKMKICIGKDGKISTINLK